MFREGGVSQPTWGIFLRCTDDVAVRIHYRQDQNPPLIEVTIENRPLKNLVKRGGDLSEESALRKAISCLFGRDWALSVTIYDRVDGLPDSAEAEGPFSSGRPKWTHQNADHAMVRGAWLVRLPALVLRDLESVRTRKDSRLLTGSTPSEAAK